MSQTSWTESLQVKDLTEQIDQGFGILDSNGRFQYVNGQLSQILGYYPEDLVGILFESLIGSDNNQEIKIESVHDYDIVFTSKSGNKIKTKVTIQSLDFPGKGWYILVTQVDDDKSRMTPQFLTAFEQAAPRMMVIGPDFNIQYVNRALAEIAPQNLIGMSALLGVEQTYRDSLKNVIEAVFEEGVVGTIEIAETSADNPTQWFVLRISPIKQGTEVVSAVITATDITDREETTRALQESEEKFRGIFENANDGMILTDESGHVSAVNRSFENLFGVKRNDLLGKPLWNVYSLLISKTEVTPEDQKELEDSISSYFVKGDASWLNEVTKGDFIHPISGLHVWFEQHAFRIPSLRGTMLCSFVWDITERNQNEEARRRSEQLYRALFEQNNDAIFILNLKGKHIEANARASELIGYSIDELKEMRYVETIVDSELHEGTKRFSEVLAGKILPIYERTLRRKNGEEIVVDVNVSLVRDDHGNPLHIQSIMRNVTENKRTLQSLKDSEERLDLAIRGADLGVWDWDVEKNELRLSDRYAGILGFAPEELRIDYAKWAAMIHPDDLLSMEERWNAHVRGKTLIYSSEHRMRTQSGEYKWILERGRVIEYNAEGGTKRASGTILDITERILAEQSLRVEEAKYRTIVEQSLIGIAILPEGSATIVFANTHLGSMLGYSPRTLESMSVEEVSSLVHDEDKEMLRDYLSRCLRKEPIEEILHCRMITKIGSQLWVELSAGRIEYNGRPAAQVTFVDITKRHDMEEGLRLSEARGRTLLQSLNDIVLVHDENDNYAEVYTGNKELLFVSPSEFIGRHVLEVLKGETANNYLKALQHVRTTGENLSIDYSLQIKDELRWFSANITPHDDRKSVVVVIRDITARYAAEETLRRDRRIFHDLAQSFIQIKDINELTTNVLTKLATNYGFDFGLFTQFIPSTNKLHRTASIGKFGTPIPLDIDLTDDNADSFLVAHIFKTKTAIFISDIEQELDERPYLRPIQRYGAKSVMAAPIVDDDENVQAVVSFATTTARIFTESDVELFSTITRMLGSVLERRNAEIQKQTAQVALERERRAFQSIANAVVNTTDANELGSNVLEGLTSALGFDFGTVRLYDAKEQVLHPTAIVGIDPSILSSDVPCRFDEKPQHLVSLAAITKERIIAPDILNHKTTLLFKERLKELKVKSIVVWPILDESENMVGILSIGSYNRIEIPETSGPFFDTLARMLNTLFERKKTEQALLISERRYRELITDISEGIGMADLNERLVFVNKPFAEILGYTPDEIVGMSIIDLVHPEDIKMILENTDRRKEGKTSTYTHRFIRRDGEHRQVRVSAVPSRDGEGKIDGTIAIVTDITEQMKAEVALRESEARFRNIFESSPVGMHLVELDDNGDLRIVDTNPAADAFDRRHRNIKHFEIGQIINYEIKGIGGIEVLERYKEILRTGIPWNVEDDIIDKQGAIVGAVQLQIFRASMRTIVTSFLDITERVIAIKEIRKLNEELAKRVEERTAQLAAANKELESFAYSVSHDLRAPLRTMDGFSQALQEDYSDKIDETGKDYLGRIRAAAIRMGSLIEDILSLSRVTRTEMDRTDVNLSDIARDVIQELTAIEPDRSVVFSTIDIAYARCDNRLMKIAIYNLIDNALKFSKKVENAKIEFGTEQREGKTVFFVKDNGAGFDMKYKEKLFTPFQRLHPPEEFEGSGIGLATVQRVINRHGGLIWAESVVNEGTTFYFTIPD